MGKGTAPVGPAQRAGSIQTRARPRRRPRVFALRVAIVVPRAALDRALRRALGHGRDPRRHRARLDGRRDGAARPVRPAVDARAGPHARRQRPQGLRPRAAGARRAAVGAGDHRHADGPRRRAARPARAVAPGGARAAPCGARRRRADRARHHVDPADGGGGRGRRPVPGVRRDRLRQRRGASEAASGPVPAGRRRAGGLDRAHRRVRGLAARPRLRGHLRRGGGRRAAPRAAAGGPRLDPLADPRGSHRRRPRVARRRARGRRVVTGVFAPGDRVQLTGHKGRRNTITLEAGGVFTTHRGSLAHDALLGQPDGSVVTGSDGTVYLALKPLLTDYVMSMPRGAAIVYPKDAGQILAAGDIAEGCRVVEAGVGSGALTLWLLRAVGPSGSLHSVERRGEFAAIAADNVAGFFGERPDRWSLTVGDLVDVLDAGEEDAADRVVLDML